MSVLILLLCGQVDEELYVNCSVHLFNICSYPLCCVVQVDEELYVNCSVHLFNICSYPRVVWFRWMRSSM